MREQAVSSRDDLRTVLQKQQRRVVATLADAETMEATPILQDDESLSAEEYLTLVYELHHVHLPELQAAGVIEFDRDEGIVRRGPHFDEARPVLGHGHDR